MESQLMEAVWNTYQAILKYSKPFSLFWQVCGNWYASQKFEYAESKIKVEIRVLGIVNNAALDHCPTISLTYCTVNGNSYDLRTKVSL